MPGRVEASGPSSSLAASGRGPAPATSSRMSSVPADAKPSEPLQREVTTTAVAAVESHSAKGRSSTSCFSGTALALRADLAGIRLGGLG
mmetsp:Transcript_24860/g.62304  ORF Transcript_24860/g.62304 Transcript_24860/m.62304 type:complete len:89 (+) Transcript_24860:2-268(+)